MKEPTKEAIEQSKAWTQEWMEDSDYATFSDWLDDKLKPKDETFEAFREQLGYLVNYNTKEFYDILRNEIFADELNGTKGLDEAIKYYSDLEHRNDCNISVTFLLNKLFEIKDRLTKGEQ